MSVEGAGGMHIIVTGASSGIGEAIARMLAANGHRLVLAARRADKLEVLAQEINPSGKRVIAVPTDMTRQADLEGLLTRARGVFGPVDVIVNNAGIGGQSAQWWSPELNIHRSVLETNLLAPIELSRLALPEMLGRGSGQIINVGSVAGRIAFSSLYSASKFGLRGFSLGLRRELLGTGVHVSHIAPGFIRTAMTAWGPPLPMPGPEVVARVVLNLLDHPRPEVIVPGWYRGLAWLETLLPGVVDRVASRNHARRNRVPEDVSTQEPHG
jgi:short-subunit dehydrogenase